MATVINMPRLSDTMEEGTVATWLKKVGDKIEEGDILAEIETDKATMEFESFHEGTLLHIGIEEGETVPVDSLLAIIGEKGEDFSDLLQNTNSKEVEKENTTPIKENKEEIIENKVVENINTETSHTNITSEGRIFVSPLAKKIAKDKGINLSEIAGTGENGRIIKKDIENYTVTSTNQKNTFTNVTKNENITTNVDDTSEIKTSQMRKTIAKALSVSKSSAPHFYLTIEVNMDNAIKSRKIINTIPDTKVSFNDIIVKACAMALRKHPQINTTWSEDTIKIHNHINIGVAVAVEDGLVVPVVRHCDNLSLSQIGVSIREFVGKAKDKKITPNEMQGSTFTISNLGMFGVESFTSIINQPNSAILSVGAIVEKPIVKDGQIVVGNTMKLTLACDHRTINGDVGAKFLQTLKTFIENPVTMIV
ncbi:MAG: pyruvate dehydrogenase complex dihydrolipoamide acetyltransferase [Tenacibaculum sp.]|nr:pyruvate dehydrogenase complex dihydrolipoamide acetyltransferase [Tenacibaculum sp.]